MAPGHRDERHGRDQCRWPCARHHDARIIYFQTVLPPISSYAISKIAAEHYLRLSGVPLTVFRLAAVYGPRNLSGAIPTFYRQVAAGEPCTVVEDATRDFVFIDDLVEQRACSEPDPRVSSTSAPESRRPSATSPNSSVRCWTWSRS